MCLGAPSALGFMLNAEALAKVAALSVETGPAADKNPPKITQSSWTRRSSNSDLWSKWTR